MKIPGIRYLLKTSTISILITASAMITSAADSRICELETRVKQSCE